MRIAIAAVLLIGCATPAPYDQVECDSDTRWFHRTLGMRTAVVPLSCAYACRSQPEQADIVAGGPCSDMNNTCPMVFLDEESGLYGCCEVSRPDAHAVVNFNTCNGQ